MSHSRVAAVLLAGLALVAGQGEAGTYAIHHRVALNLQSADRIQPFAIVHPVGCFVGDETPPPAPAFDAFTTVLHELGHCAFGLGHSSMINELNPSGAVPTAFSTGSCDLNGDGCCYLGLSPDDVNMIRMAQTGVDRAANTADDYRTYLRWVEDCAGADVRVDLTPQAFIGACDLELERSFPQGGPLVRHWSVKAPTAPPPAPVVLSVTLKFDEQWDYGPEALFLSGFESGDLSEWAVVLP